MIKLHNDDCFNIFPKLQDKSIDLVLCDMPYGTTACKWDIIIDLELMWKQLKRIVKDNAAIVLTGCQPFTSVLVTSNLKMFKYDLVWEKSHAKGHLNSKKQPLRAHESICIFYNFSPIYNPQMTTGHERKVSNNVDRTNKQSEVYGKQKTITNYDSTNRYPRSVQYFSSDMQKCKLHPTQKPVALMEYLIKTYSNEGDTVLDFCMGSGTTGVACKNLNRNFIGIEKEENYYNICKDRIGVI